MPFLFWWGCGPTWAMASSFTRFLDHTQRRNTVGLLRTSDQLVEETSTCQLTTDIHTPLAGFEPTISKVERPQSYALDRAATGTGSVHVFKRLSKVYTRTGLEGPDPRPQGRSARAENFVPTGIPSPDRPARSSVAIVAIPTELSGPLRCNAFTAQFETLSR